MNSEKMERIYKAIMLIIITAAITFLVTSTLMYNKVGIGSTSLKVESSTSNIESTFKRFHDFIAQNYIGELDEKQMMEEALKGYVYGLGDEYSEYITNTEMREYMEETIGKYVGIGVYITNNTKTNQIVVVMPIKGSPAEKAGIQSGDIISKVNGVAYSGTQINEASAVLKGEEGKKVTVEIIRNGETLSLELEREEIKVNHIESEMLSNNIAYIQISSFDEETYKEFKESWENLKSQNAKALIIDIRNNGGGIVQEALNVADMFVNKDATLLITSQKNNEEKVEKAKEDKQIDVPTVILVNEHSASASEILTAAIKENNNNSVTVVGKQTYGKGVIQTVFQLKDGSGLKLTTNEYFTPLHNKINKIGIKPDIEVSFPTDKNIYIVEKEEDTQLQKAIEVLK